eukprot:6195569-Pleurochrysis_carterae.AAC.2
MSKGRRLKGRRAKEKYEEEQRGQRGGAQGEQGSVSGDVADVREGSGIWSLSGARRLTSRVGACVNAHGWTACEENGGEECD